jgi:hypothetical protein
MFVALGGPLPFRDISNRFSDCLDIYFESLFLEAQKEHDH